jgi:hypothetical protein
MPATLDVYRVSGTAGNLDKPGAPILCYELLVDTNGGSVSGHAQINQAIGPPGGMIRIANVTGQVRELVFGGKVTLVIALQGTYLMPGPPPTQFVILEHFAANFATDQQWNGRGSFDYANGSQVVNDVPVASSKSPR